VLGHDDRFLFPTDEAHVLMAGDREVMDKAAPTTYEETVSGAAGKLTTFLSTRGPVYDEGGELLGLFGISRDVTERRAAEEELRESEAYLEAILDSTADGILAVDNRGKVLKANRRFAELWRIPEALLRVADDAALLAFVVDQLSEPQAFVAKVQSLYESDATDVDTVIFKDGRAFERHSAATMQGSAVTGRVWSFHDITERKQREEKLRLSQQRLSLHVEQTPLAVIEFDLGGRVREWNPAAAALFGYSREAAIGEYWTFIVPAAIHGQLEGVWAAIVGQRGGNRSTNENVTKDGRTISCEWFSTPLVGPGGRTIGVASLIQDVTEREQAEEEIRRQAEQLRRTVEGAVMAMSLVVETRDPYTAGHERRVAELATAIAAEMGMEGDALDALRLAGLIHDIGKIAVPAEILSKPGRLSEVEFNLIKQHPASGSEILAVIDFGLPVAEMVLQHHERLDGSGYPRGLAGEEVLPEARILAVADVVEAMSSHRPYRAALGMEAALAEVREHAGVKYDAAVVAACVRLVEEQGFEFTP